MSPTIGGICKEPFLEELLFAKTGGYTLGRFCSQIGNVTCCLPCPMDKYVYDDDFLGHLDNLTYVAIPSVILCVFLVFSWIVLPKSRTKRHYLHLGLVSSVGFLSLSFVIPISTKPKECFDYITPVSNNNSKTCAITGAFFVLGCSGIGAWSFLRVLWLHLKVYWFHTPGRAFMIFALGFGILFPAVLLAVAFNVSGFSYRTSGKMCIINHENSFTVFWAWTITLAVSSFLLQTFTSGYCFLVFLRGQRTMGTYDTSSITNTKGRKRIGRASMMVVLGLQARGSAHLQTDALNISAFRQRWNQIKAVIQSQWRVASLSVAFAGQSAPFVVHFLKSRTHTKTKKLTGCFLKYGMEDQRCLDQKAILAAAQTTIMAGLTIAAIAGIECFILTTRTSTLITWYYIFKNPIKTIRHGQYPDTEDVRKPSNANNADLSQAHSRRRSMDDILTIGHGRRRAPRNSSPAVNFRYRGSLQYPPVGYVPTSTSPTNSQRSSRQPSRTNSRTTLSKPPSRRHSYDDANGCVPPSPTHIPMKALSRLQTVLPPPLPTLPQSPNISQGDINSSIFSAQKISTPPRVRSKYSARTESSAALNGSLEGLEASYPLDRRRSLERQSRKSARTESSAALNEVLEGLTFPSPLDRRRSEESG
ncbi:DNA repair protein [Venturia inaequalis]|nr:DNA repair protein [Venturia inaequalis]